MADNSLTLDSMHNKLTGTYFTFNEFGKRKRELEGEIKKNKKEKKELEKRIMGDPEPSNEEFYAGLNKRTQITGKIVELQIKKNELVKEENKKMETRKRKEVKCSTCSLLINGKNSHVNCTKPKGILDLWNAIAIQGLTFDDIKNKVSKF